MAKIQPTKVLILLVALLLISVQAVWAKPAVMHVMEGFLPIGWAIFWWIVAIPFWVIGFIQIKKLITQQPEQRVLLGLSGGFIFVLSALKIPSVTGSSSHPTGTGLSTILYGPYAKPGGGAATQGEPEAVVGN